MSEYVNYCHGKECASGQKPELYTMPMGRDTCKQRQQCLAYRRIAINPAPDELAAHRRVMGLPRIPGCECRFFEPAPKPIA